MAFKAADIERKYNAKRLRDFFIIVKRSNSDRVHRLSLKRIHQKNDQIVKLVWRRIRYSPLRLFDFISTVVYIYIYDYQFQSFGDMLSELSRIRRNIICNSSIPATLDF